MGGESTLLTLDDARHLLRRTEFGATPRALATLLKRASTRGEAADYLLDFRPSRFRPRARSIDLAHNKWVKYMIRSKLQLQEKLVLFWHDHFATNYATVGRVTLMANQNRLLRTYCKGNFKDFVKAINLDAAMMEFLDTNDNRKQQPNENYGRELQELFTLGVNDFAGNPNYEQEDVAQIARAFTGWRYDDKGVAYFRDNRHDYMTDWPQRGAKRIYKTRGGFNDANGQDFAADGEGEAEIGRVIDIIFEHRDTDGKKTVARYIARRLVTYFAHPDPDSAFVDEVVAASGFDTQWEIAPLLRAIFVHDSFYETAAPAPFDATTKKSVKFPVDYAVGTLRLLDMKLKSKYQYVDGGSYAGIRSQLNNMGQLLFDPPSVFGWDWETAWLSSSTMLARYGFARDVTSARGRGASAFRPERLFDLNETSPVAIVAAVTELLGVTDQLTTAERDELIDYLTDGAGPLASIDLTDDDVRNSKLNGLVAIVLQSPAYQLH